MVAQKRKVVPLDAGIENINFCYPPWGIRMQTRIQNTLRRSGIMTLGQLVECEKLPPGISTVSKEIINRRLKALGHKQK